MNELKSYTEYNVKSATDYFAIGFDYSYGEDAVNVTVDGKPASDLGYTVIALDEFTIRLVPPVQSGIVRLQRETDIDQNEHAYRAGAKFLAQTMDENFEQLRHSQQEVRDGFQKLKDDTYPVIEGLEEALELAQQAANDAQDAADLASQASQDAHNASMSVLLKVNTVFEIEDLTTLPKTDGISAVVLDTVRGGYFTYHIADASINNGVSIYDGWHRQIVNDTYDLAWVGLSPTGDNTSNISRFEAVLPNVATVNLPLNGDITGVLKSNKSLVIQGNGCTLRTPLGVSDNVLSITSPYLQVQLVETTLPKYAHKATLLGVINVGVGDIITFWDRMTRPSDNSAVHFETAKVSAVRTVGTNTEVTFVESLLSPHVSANIVGYVYTPLQGVRVNNLTIVDNTVNTARCLFLEGCDNPQLDTVYVHNNFAHAVSIYNCYNPRTANIHCLNPRDTDVGGYGLVFARCRNLEAKQTYGVGTRHAVDVDSCYGTITIDGVEDLTAKSAVVGLGHNGFINGVVVCSNVVGCFDTQNYVIRINKQGLRTQADVDTHTLDDLTLNNIKYIASSTMPTGGSAQYYTVYIDINCGTVRLNNITLTHEGTVSTSVGAPVRVHAHAMKIQCVGLSADHCRYIAIIQNILTPQVGNITLNNLQCNVSYSYPVLVKGYNLDTSAVSYGTVSTSSIVLFIEGTVAGSSVNASDVNVRGLLAHRNATPKLPVERSALVNIRGMVEYPAIQYSTYNVSTLGTGVGVPYYEFYSRYGSGSFDITSDAIVSVGSSRPLPLPFVSTGMVLRVRNLGAFAITFIAQQSIETAITINAGTTVTLRSINNKWVLFN